MIITKQINGTEDDENLAKCYHIHRLVDECIKSIGKIEQLEITEKEEKIEYEWEIQQNVQQIILALTGQKRKDKLTKIKEKI
jgi:hypothetical protein